MVTMLTRRPTLARLLWEAEQQQDNYPHVDMSAYHKALKHHLNNLLPDNPERVDQHAAEISGRTAKHMHKTARRIHKIVKGHPGWSGSRVTVAPHFHYDEKRPWESNLHEPETGSRVSVHHPERPKKGEYYEHPDFTYWPWERGSKNRWERRRERQKRERREKLGLSSEKGQRKNTVDDVLHAGDPEFFPDKHPGTSSDYFHLVNGLRKDKPEKKKNSGHVTLYTARPAADRHIYKDATHLPRNLFLTANPDRAHGIAHDMGGSGGRDVWRVRIHRDHLVQTNDAPGNKDYQIVGGKGKVPVHSISSVSLHQSKTEDATVRPRTLMVLETVLPSHNKNRLG